MGISYKKLSVEKLRIVKPKFEREKLCGFTCSLCLAYHKSDNLNTREVEEMFKAPSNIFSPA